MKTRATKLAAILMAAVMTAAMAVPAFADDTAGGDSTGIAEGTTLAFNKVVEADADTYQPTETFKFTVTEATADEGEVYNKTAVFSGVEADKITIADVSTDATKKGDQTYPGTINFSGVDASKFTKPGLYKYTVKETAGQNADMTYDTDARTLYLYVKWADDNMTSTTVYGATMVKGREKNDTFTNVYEEDEEFKDLTVEKKVTGTQGDKTKLFKFKLTITSGSGRSTYVVSTTAHDSAATLTSGTAYEFQLTHGEKIVVKNLSTKDKITVDEDDYKADGYTTEGEVTNEAMKNADKTVTVTNNKDAVTPTGIFMNYGPYIAMIVAAAVLGFVFLRRKEEL